MSAGRTGMAALMALPGVHRHVTSVAERTAEIARQIAPVQTGHYRESVHVVTTPTGAAVVADVEYATAVEADHGTLSHALHQT